MLKRIPIALLGLFLLNSCKSALRESPVIYISNASLKPIKDIRCEWASKNALNLPELNPGETRSQSFYISGEQEFFGLVRIFWTNENDNTLSREFFFRKTSLPSIEDRTTYNYVQLYLDQDSIDVTTSDSPDIGGRSEKMDKLLTLYHSQYTKEHKADDPSRLISVQPRRNTTFINFLY